MSHVVRRWGYFDFIFQSPSMVIKRIVVSPHKRLSLHYHSKRAEYIGIESGSGKVYVSGINYEVVPGSFIHIPKYAEHRIMNTAVEELVIYEMEYGICEEDDQITLETDYNH